MRLTPPRPAARRALLSLLCAALALLPPSAALHAQVRLPALGESAGDEFGVRAERRIGEQIMREIRRDPDYLDDPQLLDALQALWQPLLKAARARGEITADTDTLFGWEAFLVRDRAVNAFALPGGFVGVHLGLIAITASRDELAAVLAHELSHVTQRHIARSVASGQRQSMVGLAALILGMLAASRVRGSDATHAVVAGSQAAMMQGQLNFSRDMEREADRIGFGLMDGAGFSPAGIGSMFEKLEQAYRLNDSGNYPYLRSHPLTTERIGEARARAAQLPAAELRAQRRPLQHVAMQARARVLMDSGVQALRRQQQADTVPAGAPLAERYGAAYAAALASVLLREPARADRALEAGFDAVAAAAREGDDSGERPLRLLQAQAQLARGDGRAALQALQQVGDAPELARTLLLMRAEAARAAQRQGDVAAAALLRDNAQALQAWVADKPMDAGAWAQLAQSADQLGWKLRAVRADAEAHAALGDLSGAIDRLHGGRRLVQSGQVNAGDFIDASVLDARLRALEAQRRQLAADLRSGQGF